MAAARPLPEVGLFCGGQRSTNEAAAAAVKRHRPREEAKRLVLTQNEHVSSGSLRTATASMAQAKAQLSKPFRRARSTAWQPHVGHESRLLMRRSAAVRASRSAAANSLVRRDAPGHGGERKTLACQKGLLRNAASSTQRAIPDTDELLKRQPRPPVGWQGRTQFFSGRRAVRRLRTHFSAFTPGQNPRHTQRLPIIPAPPSQVSQ